MRTQALVNVAALVNQLLEAGYHATPERLPIEVAEQTKSDIFRLALRDPDLHVGWLFATASLDSDLTDSDRVVSRPVDPQILERLEAIQSEVKIVSSGWCVRLDSEHEARLDGLTRNPVTRRLIPLTRLFVSLTPDAPGAVAKVNEDGVVFPYWSSRLPFARNGQPIAGIRGGAIHPDAPKLHHLPREGCPDRRPVAEPTLRLVHANDWHRADECDVAKLSGGCIRDR